MTRALTLEISRVLCLRHVCGGCMTSLYNVSGHLQAGLSLCANGCLYMCPWIQAQASHVNVQQICSLSGPRVLLGLTKSADLALGSKNQHAQHALHVFQSLRARSKPQSTNASDPAKLRPSTSGASMSLAWRKRRRQAESSAGASSLCSLCDVAHEV